MTSRLARFRATLTTRTALLEPLLGRVMIRTAVGGRRRFLAGLHIAI